jgi:hypothetical protein
MATITTDFASPSVSGNRAVRSSAGVVAGYIRELASVSTQAQAPVRSLAASSSRIAHETVSAAADTVGASAVTGAARRGVDNPARRSQGRARGVCSRRGKRMLESY